MPIEDTVLLTVTFIDAALLATLLLIVLRSCTSAVRSWIFAFLIPFVLLTLFLYDQYLDISEPSVEAFAATGAKRSAPNIPKV